MDWTAVIKTVAPWIGTALTGGPFVGMAISAAADALGVSERTADAVKQAVMGATPEQLLAVKKADQEFAIQMQALGLKNIKDLEEIAALDRDSARKMQMAAPSAMPAVLTAFVWLLFAVSLFVLFFVAIPDGNRDLIVYMCGQLAGASAACLAFWVGTTRQSENKTNMLAQNPAIK